jgi:hypothetical protein
MDDWFIGLAHRGQRQSKQNGKKQNLDDVTFGERIDDARRNHVHDEINDAMRLRGRDVMLNGFRVELGGISINSNTGLQPFYDEKTDDQRERCHHFKI